MKHELSKKMFCKPCLDRGKLSELKENHWDYKDIRILTEHVCHTCHTRFNPKMTKWI